MTLKKAQERVSRGSSPAVYRATGHQSSFPPEHTRLYLAHLPTELIGAWGTLGVSTTVPACVPLSLI